MRIGDIKCSNCNLEDGVSKNNFCNACSNLFSKLENLEKEIGKFKNDSLSKIDLIKNNLKKENNLRN